MIDIGRVFATSFTVLRERFWLMVGMWVVFFLVQTVASTVMTVIIGVIGLAGAFSLAGGIEDPSQLIGAGIGMVLVGVPLYAAYLGLVIAQQAAVAAIASPLVRPDFGVALGRGFRSVLPFVALMVVAIGWYAAVAVGVFLLAGLLAAGGGGTAGGAVGALALLLLVTVSIWLGCRFAPLMAVVVVDEVYNPLAALRRCWEATRGKALGILAVLALTGLLGLVAVGAPLAVVFAIVEASGSDSVVAIGLLLLSLLVIVPLLFAYSLFVPVVSAVLHAEVTDGGAERLADVFA